MQTFTGFEYLLIDAANQFGLDKLTFDKRIQWAMENLDRLEELTEEGEEKERPLYIKAVQAIRKAQRHEPTGHMVGFDAVCSGIQIMSVLTGCVAGATATGLVLPDVRSDAYTQTTDVMNDILGGAIVVPRNDAKKALMTSFYGSRKTPKEIFGEDTEELQAFYRAAQTVAPGPWELLHVLVDSWQPYALSHDWKLPDGYDVHVKVLTEREVRIEVDELDHSTFSYKYYENHGEEKGLSNAANVVHSIDAYVLRCMHRRCNYDAAIVDKAHKLITDTLLFREEYAVQERPITPDTRLAYYIEQYERSQMADVVILPHLAEENVEELSTEHLEKLLLIITTMQAHKPFPLVTIHDEFRCHPNHMNHLRRHYRNILAELCESEILSDILSQIYGEKCIWKKPDNNLADLIRQANYALC